MARSIRILLVKDDPGHSVLIRRSLSRGQVAHEVVVAENGRKALDLLAGPGPLPSVILLDLNLPEVGGLQVLRTIKSEPRTRPVPVIILTTTDSQHEIDWCYELGCNLYLTKPVDYDAFGETMRQLSSLLSLAKFPGEGGGER